MEADRKVTLNDVAREAGVAVGTASRVLNNADNVNLAARQRVQAAVGRLRYKPLRQRRRPAAAKASTPQRTRSFGLLLLGMEDSLVHVPVLSEILHGVEDAVAELNANLLLANLPTADQVPAFLKDGAVEGLLIKVSQFSKLSDLERSPLLEYLLRFPRVWLWAKPPEIPGDLCAFNHETAAHLVAGHLAARRHRRVAFLNPKKGKPSLEKLKNGFEVACAERGLELTVLESIEPHMTKWPEPAVTCADDVAPLVAQWLGIESEQRPTAIFVPADNIAVHLYRALERESIRVGRDVSVISCNNEKPIVQALKPPLTTVEVNAREIGSRSVEQLLRQMAHPQETLTHTLLLEPSIVPGESVAYCQTARAGSI
jgi:LacI family transcriptional regulator